MSNSNNKREKEEDTLQEESIDIEIKDEEEQIQEEEDRDEGEKLILTPSDLERFIEEYEQTKKNKARAEILDRLAEYSDIPVIKEFLIDVANRDNYPLCRAKAISNLSCWIEEKDIQNLILSKLSDVSPKVRLWAIWTIRPVIHLREIQDNIINKIKFSEKSRQIKLWMIRILSDQIHTEYIQEVFLYFFKLNPDVETKKLLLYYLLPKLNNEDILYTISRHVQHEKNNEIRLEIVKHLILVDEPDVKYLLENLLKTERNEEILEILKTKN